jgi:hypothetical protein
MVLISCTVQPRNNTTYLSTSSSKYDEQAFHGIDCTKCGGWPSSFSNLGLLSFVLLTPLICDCWTLGGVG